MAKYKIKATRGPGERVATDTADTLAQAQRAARRAALALNCGRPVYLPGSEPWPDASIVGGYVTSAERSAGPCALIHRTHRMSPSND